MDDARKISYAVSYLRRKKTLEEIKTLADVVAAAVLSGRTKVTITSSTMEGGASAGQVEFEAAIVGVACEQIINAAEPVSAGNRRSLGVVISA